MTKFKSGKGKKKNICDSFISSSSFKSIDFFGFILRLNRRNPDQKPIIVIDFLCMTNGFSNEPMETICGGRQQIILNRWIQLLDTLKANDCILVFSSDLNIQVGKIDEWLNRRNNEFDFTANLYDSIMSGKRLSDIVAKYGTPYKDCSFRLVSGLDAKCVLITSKN